MRVAKTAAIVADRRGRRCASGPAASIPTWLTGGRPQLNRAASPMEATSARSGRGGRSPRPGLIP